MKAEGLGRKESVKICKHILARPVQEVIDRYLNEIGSKSKIKFSRNYGCLRYLGSDYDYCQEHLTLVKA